MNSASIGNFFNKYRDYFLFNKNLILSGTSAFFVSAFVAQLYASLNTNALANSIVALVADYGIYIPFFAFLFYRDNKHRYIDPLTGKKDSKRLRYDIKKLFAAFSFSEIIFAITRTFIHYEFLQEGIEPYQASMIASLIAWIVFFASINAGIRILKLFHKT